MKARPGASHCGRNLFVQETQEKVKNPEVQRALQPAANLKREKLSVGLSTAGQNFERVCEDKDHSGSCFSGCENTAPKQQRPELRKNFGSFAD